jgi:DNA repair exonuclease SbcCD ATPase subunit
MNSIENIENNFFKIYQFVERKIGERDRIKKEIEEKENELKKIEKNRIILKKSEEILKNAYEKVRKNTMYGIELLVNKALEKIFDDITFKIELEEERNKKVAKPIVKKLTKNFEFEGDPLNSSGGTVSQIISLALRISILEKSLNPKFEGPLILDEPLTFLDEESKRKIGEFIKSLSEYLNRQIILITHDRILMEIGNKIFYVKSENGESIVKEVQSLDEIKEI